ncbi:MAG: polysaccharide biosynthesis protein [Gammaproteobacteria bacterium]|nr:polysaccharide biosynthesis protein [Gammaproteobacteria bacterium]
MPHSHPRTHFDRFRAWLKALPRPVKQLILMAFDAAAVVSALGVALKLGTQPLPGSWAALSLIAAAGVVVTLPLFARMGLYRSVLRFISSQALYALVLGAAAATAALYGVNALLGGILPWQALLRFGVLLIGVCGGGRILVRDLLNRRSRGNEAVLIYGAGETGLRLSESLQASGRSALVAFVDDEPRLHGTNIRGVRVEPSARVPQLVKAHGVRRVLLAMPQIARARRNQILAQLRPLGVEVKTVPDLADIASGAARIDEVRDIDVADVLGRDPVPPDQALLDACVRGKVVMVTGAGGSIGSELCRQILQHGPQRLVLFEMSELALYQIERELQLQIADAGAGGAPLPQIVPLIGNAHHKPRMREIMRSFGVQTVYHAAAYKHVPIVEQNMIEGIHNNVVSTWYTAEAAIETGVETFVLISTDKAVNPTNVMGATKRLAEIVLQGLQQTATRTRFCMVRFGNVLDSSGSVVPLFREQIRRGGPVTVTHPEVMRYFMTIPEAVNLVLQAGSMGEGGDVFVLDMGEPVRIADLARRMIELSGLAVRDETHPDGDIEISYTGLRPAEKLFEELLIGKNVSGTDHPMIMRAVEHSLLWVVVQEVLSDLMIILRRGDCVAARELLKRAVREYRPASDVADLVHREHRDDGTVEFEVLEQVGRVTELASRRVI